MAKVKQAPPKGTKEAPSRKKPSKKALRKAEERRELIAHSKRLAQIVNLTIGGYSVREIALATGSTEAEIERMLAQDTAQFVRTQPALRAHVRSFVTKKYTELLDTNWTDATDVDSPVRFAAQDRALKTLEGIRKLTGADAPVQSEIKIETAPESVEALVQALAAKEGMAYDVDVFDDVVDAELVEEAAHDSTKALEASSAVEEVEEDGDWSV